jgi:hypothetical protein
VLAINANAGPTSSGFIDDMPEMSSDKDRPGALIWEKSELDRSAYTKVMIEPITIFIDPKSKYKGIDADQLKALSDEFNNTITESLEPDIPIVSKAGEGVMYIRAAITNVRLKKKKRGLLSYTPVGFVARTVTDLAGKNINLVSAMLEAEVFDSKSGERLMVLIDTKPVETGEKKKQSWDDIQATLRFYAIRFRQRMEAAK